MLSTTVARPTWAGVLWVFAGAVCFSTKAVLVKLAYRYDIDSLSLVALRMLFALPIFLLILLWNQRRRPSQPALASRDIMLLLLLGCCGYYLASLLDFTGLQYLSAGMERLILFVYPTLVVLLSFLFLRKPITPTQVVALLLTYVGIAIAFAQAVVLDTSGQFWWGALCIFGSALSYAIYLIGSGELLPRIGTLRYTSYSMIVAAAAILLHHGLTQGWQLGGFDPAVYGLAALMAVIATVLPSFMISEGIRTIGASKASIIGSVGPLATILLEYWLLDEWFGGWQWVGLVFVVSGVVLISLRKS